MGAALGIERGIGPEEDALGAEEVDDAGWWQAVSWAVCRRCSSAHWCQRSPASRLALLPGNDVVVTQRQGNWRACPSYVPRMLTARAATSAMVSSEASACVSMSVLAAGVSGSVSVGLKAVAFVDDTYR